MNKLLPISALALVLAACGSGDTASNESAVEQDLKSDAAVIVETVEQAASEVTEDGFPSGESLNGLKEILPEDIAPTFTRETVIKLNAIVQSSLDTIDAYDELRRSVKNDRSLLDTDTTKAALTEMDGVAKQALKDMQGEVDRLKQSDEIYNEVVLAGMVTFVTKVEAEIAATLEDGFQF